MNDRGLPILMYHSLDESRSVISTRPAWFVATLNRLRDARMRAIDLSDWIEAGRPTVENGFAITFDDGYQNVLDAAEILARFDWPATVFLVADRLGQVNDWEAGSGSIPRLPLLSWRELKHLKAAGFRFGAHSRTHRGLDRLDEMSLVDELRGSRDAIEQAAGEPCRLFAFPYGRASKKVREISCDFFDASFGTRLNWCRKRDSRADLPRIDAFYLNSFKRIDRWVIGNSSASLTARRSLRNLRRWGVDLSTNFS